MPSSLTYPGVYIEEIPSGVRTLTGVSTAVAAFVGAARRGPIERPIRVLGFADFERVFGGLADDMELGFAVRQFFLNGGSEAWVVRLTRSSSAAFRILTAADGSTEVLRIVAVDPGSAGNRIHVHVDHATPLPDSTFNLVVALTSSDNPADTRSERFINLSMNSRDPRYVVRQVNDSSTLVRVERLATVDRLSDAGTSMGAPLTDPDTGALIDVRTLVDATHHELRLAVDGLEPITIRLNPATDLAGADALARLTSLATALRTRAQAASAGHPAFAGATFCQVHAGNSLRLTSSVPGEHSSVRVLPGERNDVSGRLRLGVAQGGREIDAVASLRPAVLPLAATLTSGVFADTDLNTLPDAAHSQILIGLDGLGPDLISLGTTPVSGANLPEKLANLARRVEDAVRALRPSHPAYREFTCRPVPRTPQIRLTSGGRGEGSAVLVAAPSERSIASQLHLLDEATPSPSPDNARLDQGAETPFTRDSLYPVFIGSQAERKGIYALEHVDLFNLLVLPGVTDPGVLADAAAYCTQRRAFLIVDAPSPDAPPGDMERIARSAALPKSRNAAVYYPWIRIANPLQGGRLRTCAPSGTMAGLLARTDASRGVWKAPAGIDATLQGVQELTYTPTDAECGILNPRGVNCLKLMPVFGAVAWGARTLRGDDELTDEYKYLPVRRLALFIEESLYRGTQWVVFEPNDETLWTQIRLNIGAFLQNLFRQGAFQGRTPREAYFVQCDSGTTTQDDINRGVVNIVVGFAPLKPAEFVVIRLQQMAGQLDS